MTTCARARLRRLAYVLVFAAVAAFAQTPETRLQSLAYSSSLDLANMDQSVNPFADFYRYSCGGQGRLKAGCGQNARPTEERFGRDRLWV